MRIKVLKRILLDGIANPVAPGTVVESKSGQQDKEFKALISQNYAVETTEKVTLVQPPAKIKPSNGEGSGKPVSGEKKAPAANGEGSGKPDSGEVNDGSKPLANADDEAFLVEVIAGTIPDVKANLDGLDDVALLRLAHLESKGKDRDGVKEAIAEARKSLEG